MMIMFKLSEIKFERGAITAQLKKALQKSLLLLFSTEVISR